MNQKTKIERIGYLATAIRKQQERIDGIEYQSKFYGGAHSVLIVSSATCAPGATTEEPVNGGLIYGSEDLKKNVRAWSDILVSSLLRNLKKDIEIMQAELDELLPEEADL